jgi:hypothetical protein
VNSESCLSVPSGKRGANSFVNCHQGPRWLSTGEIVAQLRIAVHNSVVLTKLGLGTREDAVALSGRQVELDPGLSEVGSDGPCTGAVDHRMVKPCFHGGV